MSYLIVPNFDGKILVTRFKNQNFNYENFKTYNFEVQKNKEYKIIDTLTYDNQIGSNYTVSINCESGNKYNRVDTTLLNRLKFESENADKKYDLNFDANILHSNIDKNGNGHFQYQNIITLNIFSEHEIKEELKLKIFNNQYSAEDLIYTQTIKYLKKGNNHFTITGIIPFINVSFAKNYNKYISFLILNLADTTISSYLDNDNINFNGESKKYDERIFSSKFEWINKVDSNNNGFAQSSKLKFNLKTSDNELDTIDVRLTARRKGSEFYNIFIGDIKKVITNTDYEISAFSGQTMTNNLYDFKLEGYRNTSVMYNDNRIIFTIDNSTSIELFNQYFETLTEDKP